VKSRIHRRNITYSAAIFEYSRRTLHAEARLGKAFWGQHMDISKPGFQNRVCYQSWASLQQSHVSCSKPELIQEILMNCQLLTFAGHWILSLREPLLMWHRNQHHCEGMKARPQALIRVSCIFPWKRFAERNGVWTLQHIITFIICCRDHTPFPPEDGHKTETCSGYWIK
jgi:hypothetical protein